MTTNWDRARVIVPHVEIVSVNLREAKLYTDFDPDSPPDDLEPTLLYRTEYSFSESGPDRLDVEVELNFEGNVSAKTVLNLVVIYKVVYRLEGAATYPADTLEHFADLNGVFNVWPYWRELVQTVTGRVGLPSVMVPVFKPPIVKLEEQEEDREDEVASVDRSEPGTAEAATT